MSRIPYDIFCPSCRKRFKPTRIQDIYKCPYCEKQVHTGKTLLKEEDKKEKQVEEQRQPDFFSRVPVTAKVVGALIILVKYLSIRQKGGQLKELIPWIIGVVILWYLIGSTSLKINTGILTPEEAELALNKEIKRKKKDGQIPQFAKYFIGPEIALFHHDGMPQHYQIAVEMIQNDKREYMRGVVYAEGQTKGYATLQTNMGKLTGREAIPIVSPIPRWMKKGRELDDYGFGFEKLMGGEKK
jgi:hypothetical protein